MLTLEEPTGACNDRNRVADIAKGIGILSVVLGHVIAGLSAAGIAKNDSAWIGLNRWLYSWHMPLFVVLSGMFAHRLARKKISEFATAQLFGIVLPYFFWGILQTSIHVTLSSETNTHGTWTNIVDLLYNPPMQFWFLYFIFIAQNIYFVSSKLPCSGWFFTGISFALLLLLGLIQGQSTGVPNRVRENLPFYVVGTWLSPIFLSWGPIEFKAWRNQNDGNRPIYLTMIVGACIITFLASVAISLSSLPNRILWPWYLACSFPGVISILSIANLLSRGTTIGDTLVFFGKNSLPIYLAHVIGYAGVRILLVRVMGVFDLTTHLAIGFFFGCFFPLAIVFGCEWLGLRVVPFFGNRALHHKR